MSQGYLWVQLLHIYQKYALSLVKMVQLLPKELKYQSHNAHKIRSV